MDIVKLRLEMGVKAFTGVFVTESRSLYTPAFCTDELRKQIN